MQKYQPLEKKLNLVKKSNNKPGLKNQKDFFKNIKILKKNLKIDKKLKFYLLIKNSKIQVNFLVDLI